MGLLATSCSSTYFLLMAVAERYSNYPLRSFMPTSSSPLFVSTVFVVRTLSAAFAAPNLSDHLLDCAFTCALACALLYDVFQSAYVLFSSDLSSQSSLFLEYSSVMSIAVLEKRRRVSSSIVWLARPACFYASSSILIYSGVHSTSSY